MFELLYLEGRGDSFIGINITTGGQTCTAVASPEKSVWLFPHVSTLSSGPKPLSKSEVSKEPHIWQIALLGASCGHP